VTRYELGMRYFLLVLALTASTPVTSAETLRGSAGSPFPREKPADFKTLELQNGWTQPQVYPKAKYQTLLCQAECRRS
jgi:hypothetical protein